MTSGYQYVFCIPPNAKAEMVSNTCGARHINKLQKCVKPIQDREEAANTWEKLLFQIKEEGIEADAYLLQRLTLKISPEDPIPANKPKIFAFFVRISVKLKKNIIEITYQPLVVNK